MREKLQKQMLKFTSPNPQRDNTRLINHIKKERPKFNVFNTHTRKTGSDHLVVRTLRCGSNNPGSNPGLDNSFISLDRNSTAPIDNSIILVSDRCGNNCLLETCRKPEP